MACFKVMRLQRLMLVLCIQNVPSMTEDMLLEREHIIAALTRSSSVR